MKQTFLILSKTQGKEEPVVVSGPFFKNEIEHYKEELQVLYPELIIEDIKEQWLRDNYELEYRKSFLSRPLFYIVSHIGSLELLGPLSGSSAKNIAYNEQIFLTYMPKEKVLEIAFTKDIPSDLASKITLAVSNYVINEIRVTIGDVFWVGRGIGDSIRHAYRGEFVAQRDLVNQFMNQYQE